MARNYELNNVPFLYLKTVPSGRFSLTSVTSDQLTKLIEVVLRQCINVTTTANHRAVLILLLQLAVRTVTDDDALPGGGSSTR